MLQKAAPDLIDQLRAFGYWGKARPGKCLKLGGDIHV